MTKRIIYLMIFIVQSFFLSAESKIITKEKSTLSTENGISISINKNNFNGNAIFTTSGDYTFVIRSSGGSKCPDLPYLYDITAYDSDGHTVTIHNANWHTDDGTVEYQDIYTARIVFDRYITQGIIEVSNIQVGNAMNPATEPEVFYYINLNEGYVPDLTGINAYYGGVSNPTFICKGSRIKFEAVYNKDYSYDYQPNIFYWSYKYNNDFTYTDTITSTSNLYLNIKNESGINNINIQVKTACSRCGSHKSNTIGKNVEIKPVIDVELFDIKDPRCATFRDAELKIRPGTLMDLNFTLVRYRKTEEESKGHIPITGHGGSGSSVIPSGYVPSGYVGNIKFEIPDIIDNEYYMVDSNTLKIYNDDSTEIVSGFNSAAWLVQIENNDYCPYEEFIQIQEPSQLIFNSATEVEINGNSGYHVTTPNGNDGKINLDISGGTTPYYYNNNEIAYDNTYYITGISYNVASIVIADTNGCLPISGSVNVNLEAPKDLTVTKTNQENVSCYEFDNGAINDGAINFKIEEGIGPYYAELLNESKSSVYNYKEKDVNNSNENYFDILEQGIYYLAVRDNDNSNNPGKSTEKAFQVDTIEINIAQPQNPIQISFQEFTSPKCIGGKTGAVTLEGSGGTGDYNFNISGESISDDDNDKISTIFTNLYAGNYAVTATDDNGCSKTMTNIVVPENPDTVYIQDIDSVDVACQGNATGQIIATATNGEHTGGFHFYYVNGDVNGNTLDFYSYASYNANPATITGLEKGTYTVFVEDDNDCLHAEFSNKNAYKKVIEVEGNPLMTLSTETQAVADSGASTGKITAVFNGGAGKYNWKLLTSNSLEYRNGTTYDTIFEINLPADTYTLQVIDTCNCTNQNPPFWENEVVILEPDTALAIEKDFITNPLCYGDSTGIIKVNGIGGWKDYTYYLVQDEDTLKWNNTGVFNKLPDGVYKVIVQDTMLVSTFLIDSVNQPTELILESVVVDSVKCFGGSDGSISLTLSGGTGSYYYSFNGINWNNGTVVDSLSVGTDTLLKEYTIYYQDVNECRNQFTETLYQYPEVEFEFFRTVAQTGVANGAIEVEVKGGNQPYMYKWFEKDSIELLSSDTLVTNIGAGAYELHFEDANQCIHDVDTLKLNNKFGPEISEYYSVRPTCNSWNNASISLKTQLGNEPYEVSLINETDTTVMEGLLANTEYQFTNLEASTYKLAIKDSWNWNGLDTVPIEIIDKKLLSHESFPIKHITEYGGIDSKIEFNLQGGNNFYDYALYDSTNSLIESGQTNWNVTIDSLYENKYTLAYRDTWGCANTFNSFDSILVENLQIIEPDPLVIVIDTVSMPLCYNDDNGYIGVHATGGWSNYKYRINYGSDTIFKSKSLFEYLPAGDYTINVKDSLDVISSLTIILTQPDTFILVNTIVNDVLCYDGNDGSMHFQLQGGTFPYTLINGSKEFVDTALTELEAGDYSIYFKDANKCKITDPYIDTIVQPSNIVYTIFKREAQEDLSNGSLRVEVSGGVPPYQIEWYNKDTSELLSSVDSLVNIQSDTYYLRITDSHYCEKDERYFLPKEGSPRFENITNTAITCQGYNDGKIVFDMLGVHPPYNVWLVQNNDTINQLENLNDTVDYTFENFEPGDYTIEIRDAWNWQGRKFINIHEPDYLFIETYKENILVSDENTGRIVFDIKGGNPAYKYEFINKKSGIIIESGNVGNQIIFDNLYAGQYQLYLKDTCGCTNGYDNWFTSEMVTITQPMPLQINIDQNNSSSCFGFSNGSILVSAKGGSTSNGSYKYRMNSSKWSISGAFKDLKADSYFIEVQDEAGAIVGEAVVVSQPDLLEISAINIVSDYCVEENTSTVNFDVTGGTTPYYYSLNNISWNSGTQLNNLSYGDYTIYVKDNHNHACTATPAQINIEKTDLLNVQISKQTAQLGHNNGYIEASVTGGLQAYTYAWYNASGDLISTETLLENISTGIYRFSVNDANGCNKTENIVLDAKYGPRLASTVSTIPESCKGKTDGQASFCLKDGNARYKVEVYKEGEFIQSFESINTSDTCNLSGLAAGTYTISIEDSLGWTGAGSFSISSPELVNITLESLVNPSCFAYNDAFLEVNVSGGNGNYEYNWSTGAETKQLSNLSAGTYGVTVTDMNACSETAEYTINNPELLTVDLGDDFTICSGQEYYFWSDVYHTYNWTYEGETIGTSRSIKIDEQGSYEVIVTNENGCQATDEIYIEIRDDLLEADFLMPSVAYTTDTVVVIDISWPDADNVYWNFSEGIESINSQNYYEEIIFNNSGIFKVSLISTKGACIDSVSKFINVTDIEQEKAENTKLGAKESLIKTFTVYPNPSTGEFHVKVELRESAKVEISLLRMDNQIMINKQKSNGFETYEFEYNLGQINHGIYILRLVVGSELRTKKLFIVN